MSLCVHLRSWFKNFLYSICWRWEALIIPVLCGYWASVQGHSCNWLLSSFQWAHYCSTFARIRTPALLVLKCCLTGVCRLLRWDLLTGNNSMLSKNECMRNTSGESSSECQCKDMHKVCIRCIKRLHWPPGALQNNPSMIEISQILHYWDQCFFAQLHLNIKTIKSSPALIQMTLAKKMFYSAVHG